MARKSATAEETATSPELSKGIFGDEEFRRMWEPGAGGWRPGGSDSAWMNQGLRSYLRIATALRR